MREREREREREETKFPTKNANKGRDWSPHREGPAGDVLLEATVVEERVDCGAQARHAQQRADDRLPFRVAHGSRVSLMSASLEARRKEQESE